MGRKSFSRWVVLAVASTWLCSAGVAEAKPPAARGHAAKPAGPRHRQGKALLRTSAAAKARRATPEVTLAPPLGRLAAVHKDEAPAPGPTDPDRERIVRLQQTITSILHGPTLGRLRVGMHVSEAQTGRILFRSRGPVLMDPASNQKILATTTALLRLGPDWRFRTELVGPAPDADGTVKGDLILRGSGDPSLRASDIEAMALALAERGVTRVEGGVLSDPRRLGSDETSSEERSSLRIGGSAIVVRARPGDKPGDPAAVSMRPSSDTFVLQNRAKTGKARRRGRLAVSLSTNGVGKIVVTVSGTIAQTHPGMVLRRVPPNQRLYAAALLRGALVDQGIVVLDAAGVLPAATKPAAKLQLLARHESEPLSIISRRINKDSDNEYADRLLDVVGAEVLGGAATPQKGLRVLREAMTELGIAADSYVPTNGSGLGHRNRVTADAVAELLKKIYYDPRVGPEIMQSLSVGGIDGTIRNRFRGSPAAERVRAKTGTLNGKSCLSGYVGDGDDVVVFSILVEGLRARRLSAVRAAQVSAVNAMMHYARGAEGEPSSDEADVPTDYEVGDDVIDGDEEETPTPAPAAPPPTTKAAAPAPRTTRAAAPSPAPRPLVTEAR